MSKDREKWKVLQKKVFGRWIRQKVYLSRGIEVTDVLTDFKDGKLLKALIEVLSEKQYGGRWEAKNMDIHKIQNIGNALNFAYENGVVIPIKFNNEDIMKGDEKTILGLIWGIMLRFIKFEDSDEALDASQALLLWVRNKCSGPEYANVTITDNFKSSFRNGLALCALIHKHRPKLIDYASLTPEDSVRNFGVALEAANRYFGLERYLEPDEIAELDEKSMFIFVSEFYYGIAEQRKLDLAARRISKLVIKTRENDALKLSFNTKAKEFKERVADVQKMLADVVIDDTLAGAKRRIDEFYVYKLEKKNEILRLQLELEALFTNIQTRLTQMKRPPFQPYQGLTLTDIINTVRALEVSEQERNAKLIEELNRQLRLHNLNKQHEERHAKILHFAQTKLKYLETKEDITSSAEGRKQLQFCDSCNNEVQNIKKTSVHEFIDRGEFLLKERFEHSADVSNRNTQISKLFAQLDELYAHKKPILQDDYKRELYKEETFLFVNEHEQIYEDLNNNWFVAKRSYLKTKEDINSLPEALAALNNLDTFVREKERLIVASVEPLKELGKKINARSYHGISHWDFPHKDKINGYASSVDNQLAELDKLSADKRVILLDDEERERYIEATNLLVMEHDVCHKGFLNWFIAKNKYLTHKEEIDTLPEALAALNALDSYVRENERVVNTTVVSLKQLGKNIKARAYHKISNWTFPDYELIDSREKDVDGKLSELHNLCNNKRQVLEDDKKREEEKERLRLLFANQASEFKAWESDVITAAEVAHFGFNLKEVEAFGPVLDKIEADVVHTGDTRKAEYEDTNAKLKHLNVRDNVYTVYVTSDLVEARAKVDSAVAARRHKYNEELSVQRYNDQLCQKFAKLVDPLARFIRDGKEAITSSNSSLEDQLSLVNTKLGSRDNDGRVLHDIQVVAKEMEDRKITHNEHTTLTVKDIGVQWDQYKSFLENKKKQIEEEIELAKLRGLTPDDLKEIEDNFRTYDKNHNNHLDTNELKACLYSLGEERKKSDVEALMQKYGDGRNLTYPQFFELMIQVFGDLDTKDEILNGFKLINRVAEGHPPVATREKLSNVMQDDPVNYILTTAPPRDDGVDYSAWTEDVFSR